MTDRASAILSSAASITLAGMVFHGKEKMSETEIPFSADDRDAIALASDSGITWITVNGAHIPIKDGVATGGFMKGKSVHEIHNSAANHHDNQGLKASEASLDAFGRGGEAESKRLSDKSEAHHKKASELRHQGLMTSDQHRAASDSHFDAHPNESDQGKAAEHLKLAQHHDQLARATAISRSDAANEPSGRNHAEANERGAQEHEAMANQEKDKASEARSAGKHLSAGAHDEAAAMHTAKAGEIRTDATNYANSLSKKAGAGGSKDDHRAAAQAHSDLATESLKRGDKAAWEKHADKAFEHYGHAEGWHDGEGGSKWTASQHEAAATAENGKAKQAKSDGNPAKAATHNRFSGKHGKISRDKQDAAKAASNEADDHSYVAGIGNGSEGAHAKAAAAHEVAAKLHRAAGDENEAKLHDSEAAHHKREAKFAAGESGGPSKGRGLSADAIILDASGMGAITEVKPDALPDYEEIPTDEISHVLNEKPVFKVRAVPVRYFRKELARAGHWTHRGARHELTGAPVEFDLTTNDFDDAVNNFKMRKDRGITPFIPDSHVEQREASANNGQVIDLQRDGDSLIGTLKVVGEKAIEKTLKNDVSVYLVNGNDQLVVDAGTGTAGSAQVYHGRVLHHVALTPNPNQPHLKPFERIAASADAAETRDVPVFSFGGNLSLGANTMACTPAEMAMAKEHLTGMGEKDMADSMTPETAMATVVAHGKKMANKHKAAQTVLGLSADAPVDTAIAALKTERDALVTERDRVKTELAAKSNEVIALSAGDPDKIEPMAVSLIARAFKTDRAQVIASGVISEAGMNEVDALMLSNGRPTRQALALSAGSTDPFYSRLCDILRRNPGIKTNNGVARGDVTAVSQEQAIALDATREDPNAPKPITEERKRQILGTIGLEPMKK